MMTKEATPAAAGHSTISGCTCFKLRALTRRVTAFYDRALAPAGIKVNQYSLLAHLAGGVPLSVSELAALLAADRTTVTRNLQALMAAGLVDVGPGADARTRAVRIAPRGKTVLKAARPLWKSAQHAMVDIAGTDQLAALHGLMEALLPRLPVAA